MSNALQKKQKSQQSDKERVRDFQRKLYRKAKREPGIRFYVLYDKVGLPHFLREAYKRVKANGGVPGVDGVTFAEIESKGLTNYLTEISAEIKQESYRPLPVKRVFILKSNGKKRPLGIPTIKDRIVQMSCKLVIEPIYESDFEDSSYGFRPKRSAEGAIKEIKRNLKEGKTEVFDADISKYFDTIPHDKLLIVVAKRISDRKIIHLIKMWLKSPIDEDGKISGGKKNKLGIPQGGVISPLLANIYLHLFDKLVNTKDMFKRIGVKIIRYADDFILIGKEIPDGILEYVTDILERMGLKLNTEKSRKINSKEESFNFLGFVFRYDRGQTDWRQMYWHIEPSMESQNKVRANIKEYFKKNRYKPMPEFSPGLNAILRGWMNYYHIPKVSYCRKTFNHLKWHLDVKLWKHYERKSQKVSKLYRRYGFEGMVKKYGLIDPSKYIYQHQLVKA